MHISTTRSFLLLLFNSLYTPLLLSPLKVNAMLSGLPSFYYLPPTCPCSHTTCSPNEEPLMEIGELERASHQHPKPHHSPLLVPYSPTSVHQLQPNVWSNQQTHVQQSTACTGPVNLNLCICTNNNNQPEQTTTSTTMPSFSINGENAINHGRQLPLISYMTAKPLKFLPDLNNWHRKAVEEEKEDENAVQSEIPASFKIERNKGP